MDKFWFLFVSVSVTCTSSIYAEGINRILNGSPAAENQFPYMISLQRIGLSPTTNRGHRCGGALVTLQHAVTTASCTLDIVGNNMVPIAPAGYRVFAGSVDLTNDTSADRVRRIANITIHPEYDTSIIPSHRLPNDIAVIILGNPFLESTVAYLPIANHGLTETVTCTLSGWGAQGSPTTQGTATISTQLIHTQKLTVNQFVCAAIVGSLPISMLCAGAASAGIIEGAAGCTGDEGSPLVCHGGLVGLLIETSDCSSVPYSPQVYTRVSSYDAWINYVVTQPIPDIGPEPSTQSPATSTTPVTSPAPSPATPDGASASQPGVAVLALIIIAQIIANAINKT